MNIRADKVLTRLMIEFWDLAKVVFIFVDCKLLPTLEEINSFIELLFAGKKPILSVVMHDHRFFHALGLTNNKN